MNIPHPHSRAPSERIAVTGATGFVGSALVRRLAYGGHCVSAITRRPTAIESAVVRPVGDLEQSTQLASALCGVDAIVHLAARVHVMAETTDADPLPLYRAVNVEGTRRVAEAAAEAGVRRLVYLSSIKVLGESTTGRPFTASDNPAPLDPYGQSKWEAEQALWEIARDTGLDVVIVRPPLVYGPGVKANFERLMGLVQRGVPLPLGAVRNRRAMIGLDNLVDLLVRCVECPGASGKTLLASDGNDLSTPELIRLIAGAMGRPPRLIPFPEALLRLAGTATGKSAEVGRLCGSLQMDSSETRRILGWTPPVSVEEGIQRTVDAFLGAQSDKTAAVGT